MKFRLAFRMLIQLGSLLMACGLFLSACSNATGVEDPNSEITASSHSEEEGDVPAQLLETDQLSLPDLTAVPLNGQPLRVVATTSIIGDVVAQVGGQDIDLTVLMGPGQDPHSYEPAARDLTAVAGAQVIFVNGWDLEEGLAGDLGTIAPAVPVVPLSANITPLEFRSAHLEEAEAEDADHQHHTADPHVWFGVPNVMQWVMNLALVLTDLDPANAARYERNAAAYLEELEALNAYTQTRLAEVPANRRLLVTNHDSFGYVAHEYGFSILGSVIPGSSTLADLMAGMDSNEVGTIFTETTVSDTLA